MKLILSLILCTSAWGQMLLPIVGGGAPSGPRFVAQASAASGNTTSVTTSAIDTTGANFLVLTVVDAYGQTYTVTDARTGCSSPCNTWVARIRNNSTGATPQIWYVAAPTVGAGHVFTVTCTGTCYPSEVVFAFSAPGTRAYDVENQGQCGSGTCGGHVQTASITPTQAQDVIVMGAGWIYNSPTSATIDLGFSTPVCLGPASSYSICASYLIQPTAAAIAPTLTFAGEGDVSAVIVAFKTH